MTVVDHLYALHMQWANMMVIASREHLSADHPVRRFLTPYYFGTIQVNAIANHILISRGTLGSRNFAFTDQGLREAWQAVPSVMVDGAELRGKVGDAEPLRLIFNIPDYYAEQCIMNKGGVLIRNAHAFHCGGINFSDRDRILPGFTLITRVPRTMGEPAQQQVQLEMMADAENQQAQLPVFLRQYFTGRTI